MSKALALPDPQTLAAGQVPALIVRVRELREFLRSKGDMDGARELRQRLAAYERYISDKKARANLEAESRLTEVLIGQLLGPAVIGRPSEKVSAGNLSKKERHVFRELAEHADIVDEQLAAKQTKRAKILVAIERAKLAERGADISESKTRVGDFRDVLTDLPDASVDLIFTDPPYDKGAVELYADLAEFGRRVLKPGASLLAYCGQYALPQILPDMSAHLRFWWLCACVHEGGNHKSLAGVKTYVLWKPIVWFVKDTNWADEFVYDAVIRKTPDKTSHDWAQALEEPLHYIDKLCPSGGLVVDPFAGGGTTQLAAERLGRRFVGAELNPEQQAVATGRQAA